MVSQTLLSELNVILQEDYKVTLPPQELVEVASSLVGIFELLAKMDVGLLNEDKKNEDKNYEHTILS